MTEIGVDIGGTFTDVVCRRAGEPLKIVKIPSTRADPSVAVLRSVKHMVETWGVDPAEIARFVHGTTVATNAVIERKGAKIGLLTTQGFKDVLEIGRQMRQAMYDLVLEPETPVFLAPGRYRKEVPERLDAEGQVLVPLDEAAVVAAVRDLVDDGVEAVAVCFLFSFLDPRHEQRARDLIEGHFPDLMVSLSCEVDPAFREYERTAVTAFDAYVKPVIDRYLERLEGGIAEAGVSAPLQVMMSRGGAAASSIVRQRPVRLFLSGPAAGVVGGRMVGRAAGTEDVITVDVGGTSCDIALIAAGKPMIRQEGRIEGFPVRVPMVDVNAIGAGGGSIAWLDGAGGLKVGPQSAGSGPGPACYGAGGEAATVTDASVVLGYLNPDYFAGGALRLHAEAARAVIEREIATPLGLSVEAAALGIHRVVNAQMAEGIRLVSIRQGLDPRLFTLLPLGGAGPVHATALARELGIRRIVVPRFPGVLSAAGLLAAQVEHEVSTAFPRPLAGLGLADVRDVLADLDRRCAALMARESGALSDLRVLHYADVCYIGQSYHLEVPLDLAADDPLRALYRDFQAAHDKIYGHSTDAPAQIVNLRSVHQAGGSDRLEDGAYRANGEAVTPGTRRILLSEQTEPVEAAVFDRATLPVGHAIAGPAIVEQADTTTVIEPGWSATVTEAGDLIIERDAS